MTLSKASGAEPNATPIDLAIVEGDRAVDTHATYPRCPPTCKGGVSSVHPATQQIEGEDLEQERGLVGVERIGGNLADAEAALQFGDERFDGGAIVVATTELVGVVDEVVGDEDVDRVVEVLTEARLLAAEPVVGPHGEDPPLARGPVFAREVDLGHLPRGLALRVAFHGEPVSRRPDGTDEVRGLPELDEEPGSFIVDRTENWATIAAGIDAHREECRRSRGLAQPLDPLHDVQLAQTAIAWAEPSPDDRPRLSDTGQNRMITWTPVVARVGAGQGALLFAKQRHHRRVDVGEDFAAPS